MKRFVEYIHPCKISSCDCDKDGDKTLKTFAETIFAIEEMLNDLAESVERLEAKLPCQHCGALGLHQCPFDKPSY